MDIELISGVSSTPESRSVTRLDRAVPAGVLRAVVLGYVQTEDLDETHREEIRDELVDVVATGLTCRPD